MDHLTAQTSKSPVRIDYFHAEKRLNPESPQSLKAPNDRSASPIASRRPEIRLRAGSRYKIAFLTGDKEAMSTSPARTWYTSISTDEQSSPSKAPSLPSSTAERPQITHYERLTAHKQLRHGSSKEHQRDHTLPCDLFPAKNRNLVKRKPRMLFDHIGENGLANTSTACSR